MTPEQQLVLAIIKQSVVDLWIGTPVATNPEEASTARWEAMLFLTQERGGWQKRRDELCSLVDLDPDHIRRETISVLEGAPLPHYSDMRGNGIEMARALWAKEKARHAAANAARQRTRTKPVRQIDEQPTERPANCPPSTSPVKETRRAAKPWLCPPRDPADDWLYGIASA